MSIQIISCDMNNSFDSYCYIAFFIAYSFIKMVSSNIKLNPRNKTLRPLITHTFFGTNDMPPIF